MKILIVSRYVVYPSWQGPAQHARTFAKALIKAGHQVRMVSGEDVPTVDEVTQDGYRVTRIPMVRKGGKLEFLASVGLREETNYSTAKTLIEECQPDVVHVGVNIQMGPFIEVAKQLGVPVVAMVHDYSWLCMTRFLINDGGIFCEGPETFEKCIRCAKRQLSPKRRAAVSLYEFLNRLNVLPGLLPEKIVRKFDVGGTVTDALNYLARYRNLVDYFIVQTPVTQSIFSKFGVNPAKLAFIGQWLSEEKLLKYPKVSSARVDGKIRLGYIGRLDSEKGLHVLGKALRRLGMFNEYELWILSSGATMPKLQELTGGLPESLTVRIFDNLQGGTSLPETIAQLDLSIVPSIWSETGPRVLIEAIAQNVPCIAADGLGNSYLIQDGVNGRLFRMGDADSLCQVLKETFDRPAYINDWSKALPGIMGEEEWFAQVLRLHERATDTCSVANNSVR